MDQLYQNQEGKSCLSQWQGSEPRHGKHKAWMLLTQLMACTVLSVSVRTTTPTLLEMSALQNQEDVVTSKNSTNK